MRLLISAFATAAVALVSTADFAVAQRSWNECFQIARERGFSVSEYDHGRNSGRAFMNACMQGRTVAAAVAAEKRQPAPQARAAAAGGRESRCDSDCRRCGKDRFLAAVLWETDGALRETGRNSISGTLTYR